jgi:5-methylcytosine-specific restriction endonuclease McrA
MGQFFEYYNRYLQSPAWLAKRAKVLKRDNYTCQACLDEPATEVHHKSYIHFGNEPLFDLVSVGDICHKFITQVERRRIKKPDLSDEIRRILQDPEL